MRAAALALILAVACNGGLPLLTVLSPGLSVMGSALAAEPLQFDNAAEQARFEALTQELRCLVCQNQNLADSDAPLAHDLRVEIHEMMRAGKSDAEIKTFLVDRYGDFVLYRPPVKGNTLALWLLPAGLLLAGAIVLVLMVRRHARMPTLSPEHDLGQDMGGDMGRDTAGNINPGAAPGDRP